MSKEEENKLIDLINEVARCKSFYDANEIIEYVNKLIYKAVSNDRADRETL